MGILRNLADRFDPHETRDASTWDLLSNGAALDGQLINSRTAENLSTVLACVGAISSAISSLPAYVFKRVEHGREYDSAHPVSRLIAYGPNQHQSWPDWIEWTLASVLLRGNSISEVVTDARGAPVELRPIPWDWVSVELLPNGRLVYEVTEILSLVGGTGQARRLLQHEVFHLRDRTDDGLVGKSRLQRASAVVSAGLGVQQFATSMYRNGINPSGALEVDGKLGTDAYNKLAESLRTAFAGAQNAAKALILDQGVKWKQISISPEDAELLDSRRFTVEELARLFGTPPPIIGDLSNGTFTNTETVGRWFAQHTLTPWIRKLESEFKRSVFSASSRASHQIEIDLSGFMRGDPEQRWRAHEIAVKNNILTPDEVRESEGWNPLPAQHS